MARIKKFGRNSFKGNQNAIKSGKSASNLLVGKSVSTDAESEVRPTPTNTRPSTSRTKLKYFRPFEYCNLFAEFHNFVFFVN